MGTGNDVDISLPTCFFRERIVSEDGQHVYRCKAGNGYVLGPVGSEVVQKICGSCPVPSEYAPERKPCLYLVPLRIFGSEGIQTFMLCHWFYRNSPSRWVHMAKHQCPCHYWFPHPEEYRSEALEAMNTRVIKDALKLYAAQQALLAALRKPDVGCSVCQCVAPELLPFLNSLSSDERSHLCSIHHAQLQKAEGVLSREEQLYLLDTAEEELRKLAQPPTPSSRRSLLHWWKESPQEPDAKEADEEKPSCTGCAKAEELSIDVLNELMEILRDPGRRRLYESSAVLCSIHLCQAVVGIGGAWRELFIALQQKALARQRMVLNAGREAEARDS